MHVATGNNYFPIAIQLDPDSYPTDIVLVARLQHPRQSFASYVWLLALVALYIDDGNVNGKVIDLYSISSCRETIPLEVGLDT